MIFNTFGDWFWPPLFLNFSYAYFLFLSRIPITLMLTHLISDRSVQLCSFFFNCSSSNWMISIVLSSTSLILLTFQIDSSPISEFFISIIVHFNSGHFVWFFFIIYISSLIISIGWDRDLKLPFSSSDPVFLFLWMYRHTYNSCFESFSVI